MYGSQSFSELHKTAYSHGLESIYSIENIDLRTVRRLSENPIQPTAPLKKSSKPLKKINQYELDFGTGFRTWIAPFFPVESITHLKLSKFAEKALLEQGKHKIGDLLDLKELRGLGQGHLVEIGERVREYVADRDPKQAETIDFAGWIRALFAGVELKKLYPLLEKYQLQDLIAITAAESVEVKRLNGEQREEKCREAVAAVDWKFLDEARKSITGAFLKPWIAERQGIASQEEIEEHLERIAEDGEVALKALKLLNGCFGGEHNPPFFFGKYITPFTGNLFAINSAYANDGTALLRLAATYFYSQQAYYPFKELVSLLKRELACHWRGMPEKFIEKILFSAPQFRLSKNLQGQLCVYANASLRMWQAKHA